MDFHPHRLRAFPLPLRAHTLIDTVARHYTLGPFPKGETGKFLKDDQCAKGVQDYLAERYVDAMVFRRRGRYEPRQIVRNFFR